MHGGRQRGMEGGRERGREGVKEEYTYIIVSSMPWVQ